MKKALLLSLALSLTLYSLRTTMYRWTDKHILVHTYTYILVIILSSNTTHVLLLLKPIQGEIWRVERIYYYYHR